MSLDGAPAHLRSIGVGLVLTVAACSAVAAPREQAWEPRGPIPVRNEFLLGLGFLHFESTAATVREDGEWQVELIESVANTFANSAAIEGVLDHRRGRSPLLPRELGTIHPQESLFIIDGETHRTAVGLRRGLPQGFEAEVQIPLLTAQGAWMDGAVERVHDRLGVSQAGRDGYPRDDFLVYLRNRDGVTRVDQAPGSGLGDAVFSLKAQLPVDPWGVALAMAGSVKLPTGDADRLWSSGSVDVGVRLLGSRAFSWGCLHGAAGGIWLGPFDRLGTRRQLVSSAMASAEVFVGTRASAVFQLTTSESPFSEMGFAELADPTVLVSAGVRQPVGTLGSQWFVSLTENVGNHDNSADVTIQLGFTHVFGPRR